MFTFITLIGLAGAVDASLPAFVTGTLPTLLTALGFVGTLILPRWIPRVLLARELKKRDLYPWPAPAFNTRLRRAAEGNQHDAIIVGSGTSAA